MAIKPRKYDPLRDHLTRQTAQTLQMSFDAIADLVGVVPRSAYDYDAWWANEKSPNSSHVHCRAWLDAGYEAKPNRKAKTVTFKRI